MKNRAFASVIFLFVLFHCNFSFCGEVVIQPGPDEVLDMWTSSVYHGGGKDTNYLVTGGWGDYYYTYFQMNIDHQPSDVISAKLYLYSTGGNTVPSHTMYLDKVTSSWDETTKWNNNPNSEFQKMLPTPTYNSWYVIDITDLYNGWKNGSFPNYGIRLRPTNINHSYNAFHSSDYLEDPTLRPKLVLDVPNTDSDYDGVLDDQDQCPDTNLDAIVDSNGCSIDQLVPCDRPKGENRPWKNHGEYVKTVTKTANDFVTKGLITDEEKGYIVSDAAKSNCGKK